MTVDENGVVIVEEEWDEEVDEGAEGKTGATKNKSASANADPKRSKPSGKTFTQAQVSKMNTQEKAQGRASFARELGIDPNNRKAIEAARALLASQKSDEEISAEALSEQAKKLAEVEHRALVAEAKAEAMQQGVKTQYVDDAVTLVMAKVTDDNDFITVIGELKIKHPTWFGEEEEDGEGVKDTKNVKDAKNSVGKRGTGSSVKAADAKGGKEELGMGARLAAQRKESAPASKYWGVKGK